MPLFECGSCGEVVYRYASHYNPNRPTPSSHCGQGETFTRRNKHLKETRTDCPGHLARPVTGIPPAFGWHK